MKKVFDRRTTVFSPAGFQCPPEKTFGFVRSANTFVGAQWPPRAGRFTLCYSRTQRTEKPLARPPLLTGYTPPELKPKLPAPTSDEYGELLQ